MDLTTIIRKIGIAAQNGATHIAPSDAQGIFDRAYGPHANWPASDPAHSGHYPVEVVQEAINAIREQARELAASAEMLDGDDSEPEPNSATSGRIDTSTLPEYAKASLMDAGLYTFDQIRAHLDQGHDLTDFDRIGVSTAEKIKRLLGYPIDDDSEPSAPTASAASAQTATDTEQE